MSDEYFDRVDWDLIPDYMRASIQDYILLGRPVGHFLTAVFSNDLKEACIRADDVNIQHIGNYAKFLYNYAPIGCWGSPENHKNWLKSGGLVELDRKREALADAESRAMEDAEREEAEKARRG